MQRSIRPGAGSAANDEPPADPLRFGEYLLGLEGLALLRLGASARGDSNGQRVHEIMDLASRLHEPALADTRHLPSTDPQIGYAVWAQTYDDRHNPLIAIEEPPMRTVLDGLPVGPVLDAACGTGRLTAHLAATHAVIGVDSSPEMLARARAKLPTVEFRDGDLSSLPLASESVTAAVCALALSHMPDLRAPIAELARVVSPGGRIVISNPHPIVTGIVGWRAWYARPDESRAFIPEYAHWHGAYIDAFVAAGLVVRRCLEPTIPADLARAMSRGWVDDAAEIAVAGLPGVLIWELVRT